MRSLFFLLMCTLMYTTTSAQSSLSVTIEIEARIPCWNAGRVGALKVKVKGGEPPYEYSWSDTKIKGRRPRNIASGVYTVTVTDKKGTKESATVTLEKPPTLRVDIDELVGTSEKGARDGRVRVKAGGGTPPFTYKWDNGATTQTLISLPEGKYNVTITDKYNCRTLAAISIDPPKEADIVIEEVTTPQPETQAEPEAILEPEAQPQPLITVQELSTATDLEVGQVLQVEKLFFKADAADIKEESYPVLDEIYDFLTNNNVVVEIGGHTNSIPSDDYCFKLSDSRAKTVAEYLYGKGIPESQVSYKGYGKTEPIADNDTAQGRKRNQRVEIKILEVKGE